MTAAEQRSAAGSRAAIRRSDLVAEALTWRETPYRDHIAAKGIGTDCVGYLSAVASKFGIAHRLPAGYPSAPGDRSARRAIEELCGPPIAPAAMRPADVLLFRIGEHEQHFGLVTALEPEPYFIHAFARQKIDRVVVNRLDRFWRARLVGVYRIPGLED